MKIRAIKIFPLPMLVCHLVACTPKSENTSLVPAEAFTKAANAGNIASYSFNKANLEKKAELQKALGVENFKTGATYKGDPKMLSEGLTLKRSYSANPTLAGNTNREKMFAMGGGEGAKRGQLDSNLPTPSPLSNNNAVAQENIGLDGAPPGSSAPYLNGQMKSNPSLWPDQVLGQFIFTDHRAYNPMDIVTITINDNTIGQKRGDTQTKTQFDLLAGITNFFGIEDRWASNNEGLDAAALIKANTESQYKGTANIQRQGSLQAQLSAVILELLPNGVLRLEGSKIVSINNEEEIMVISGLVRQRDISSDNKVDSNRIANMRIDFYGHGNLSEAQSPGWGARIIGVVWPF